MLTCTSCQKQYPVRQGIPIFLVDQMALSSADPAYAQLDDCTKQKIRQREWHDTSHMDDEYKQVAYDSPTMFAHILYYQLRDVERLLADRKYDRIANICSGLGFELEFLARLGKRILAVDISWRSLCKTRERGKRLGLDVEAVCCDAENLPLIDESFDLALTHHSFHHLVDPMRGLDEIVRISRHRAAFFEPAKGMTRTVVRKLRLKPEVEESGNYVYEFGRRDLEEFCRSHSISLAYFHKCLITGPTEEPEFFRKLDAWKLSGAFGKAIRVGNSVLGGVIGTKCGVVLEKSAVATAAVGG
jgi:SAM-dependent methyltransferase